MEERFQAILQSLSMDHAGKQVGKDDILQLNIGGKNCNLERSMITQCTISSGNLLSYLFNKRWEKLLMRDKNGCVFLDWNQEWIQPILDQIIHRKLFFSSESKEFSFPVKSEQEAESLKVVLPLLNFGDSILLEETERISGFRESVKHPYSEIKLISTSFCHLSMQ
jgi:hypothetical protein